MPAQVTTRAQVNGYRFLIRRLEHALIRADSRMIHDPMRGQMRALLVGVVIAILITGAAGVLAFMKPTPNFGDSSIMLNASSGELLVRMGDRLHPVLNLSSARLIVGKSDPPKEVDGKFINSVALGPAVGIIGAPVSINGGDNLAISSWTVCDSTRLPSATEQDAGATVHTTVLANDPDLDGSMRAASSDQAILAASGGSTFLIYDGVRAAINPADPVLQRALRLADNERREVSTGFLNSFPSVDPILPITITGTGEPTTYLPPIYPVGSILRTTDSHGDQLYVAMREGLQPISVPTADIIRYGNAQSPMASDPTAISPALIDQAPIVHVLPVDHYPAAAPSLVHTDSENTVACMSWQHASSGTGANRRLLIGSHLPLPATATPVGLATSDGDGPGLDSVYLKPGTGEYVQSTGNDPDSPASGQLFYVSDLGVRYHIADSSAAAALGVVGQTTAGRTVATPQQAPWAVLSLLPPGPELSQRAALIAHDGIPADPNGSTITAPQS